MDSAPASPTVEQIASLVVQKLTQGGKLADLAQADLMTIEEETIEEVDQVTRAVMNQLLASHRETTDPPAACPKCGAPMCSKPPQGRSLQSTRGRIHFQTDVVRCEACRLDFFPSAQNPPL